MLLVQIVIFTLIGIVICMGLDELSRKFDVTTAALTLILLGVDIYFGYQIIGVIFQ